VGSGERLPPAIHEAILKLENDNPEIKIETWGYEVLRRQLQKLSLKDLEFWFGQPLNREVMVCLGFEDIRGVLEHIKSSYVSETSEIKNVSPAKIEANLLTKSVSDFLTMGMQKSHLVAQFFNQWYDPLYGEKIAGAFKKKYIELRNIKPPLHPDLIYGRIEHWAGGADNPDPKHKAAVLAVLAYFFDKCEIFEDAQEER